jgi:superfamily I DNA/RNA helicase
MTIAPDDLIRRSDPRSGEDLDACWTDFLEKPHARQRILGIINQLEVRESNVDASRYILDELIWIRSGFGRESRNQYLTCSRFGRGIELPRYDPEKIAKASQKLDGNFPSDTRKRILDLLRDYEEYMAAGGLLDDDGVSLAAHSLRDRIAGCPELRARCVLIDEMQDCSTVELAVLAQVPTDPLDGLFLTGGNTSADCSVRRMSGIARSAFVG